MPSRVFVERLKIEGTASRLASWLSCVHVLPKGSDKEGDAKGAPIRATQHMCTTGTGAGQTPFNI